MAVLSSRPDFRIILLISICMGGLLASPVGAQGEESEEAPASVRLQDVYLKETADKLVFGNAHVELTFNRESGKWTSLTTDVAPGNFLTPDGEALTVDARVEGEWLSQEYGADVLGHEVAIDRRREKVFLRLRYELVSDSTREAYRLTVTYALSPDQNRVKRSADLRRTTAASTEGPVRLQRFRFTLPGVKVGSRQQSTVSVPGPWYTETFVPPGTAYEALVDTSMTFHSAPDAGFGVVGMANKQENAALAAWMETAGGEVHYRPTLRGGGSKISVVVENPRAYRLHPQQSASSDVQRLQIAWGSFQETLDSYRQMVNANMPTARNETPDWVDDMVLLEILPSFFDGGFTEITRKLSRYREIGFNALYLMPHWKGGYSPIDYYEIKPELGTKEELQALVEEAHRLEMRVMFDMVIHGFNEDSPILQQRPDLFVHKVGGGIVRHATWRSMSTDWASEAYQSYMAELARHHAETYNMDGYRLDAAAYKGPNWMPDLAYPAYRSGTASPAVIRAIRDGLQAVNPEATILNEVFGPVFYSVSNLSHDNQTSAAQVFLEQMKAGRVTARHYKEHLENVYAMLPEGANRVFYARNHDTSWFYHFNGYTPRFMAMEAIHAFTAIPSVFAGDPNNGPNPDSSVYAYYEDLFELRERFPELADGTLLLREVESSEPKVFTSVRAADNQASLVVVSLAADARETTITVPDSRVSGRDQLTLHDPINDTTITLEIPADSPGTFKISLEPYQVLVGRM